MKKNALYSTLGIIAVIVAIVVANWVLGLTRARVDLTAGNLYTLSEATRSSIQKLQEPVKIKFYATQGDDSIPIQVRVFSKRVEDLLTEYRAVNRDKIQIERLNPEPDSDAEDQATVDGIEAQTTGGGERFYLGLAVSQGDRKTSIPVLDGNRERLLEYDLTRAITRVTTKEKPVIGIFSPLPLQGNPMAAMMGGPPAGPLVFYSELERDYTLKNVPASADRIDEDIKTLIVVHPRGISDQAQYAIDQFVLRGGRLIAFVDPMAYFDQRPGPMGMQMPSAPSNLEKLFKAWGVEMASDKVVLDLQHGAGAGQRLMPTVLALDGPAINPNDIATGQIPNALIPMAGALISKPVEGIKQTVLLRSSKQSMLVDAAKAGETGQQTVMGFKPSGEEYAIAMRLSGKFKTAYPDGVPPAKPEEPRAEDKRGDAKPAAPAATPLPAQLKEAVTDTTVGIVADSDLLQDGAAVRIQEFFGRRIVIPANGNLPFFNALVEQMAGDPALARLSTRAVSARPLSVVKEMEAEAQQAYLGKLKGLEDNLSATKLKLADLDKGRGPAGGDASKGLSPEQKAEVDKFRLQAVETRRELKELRRDLRADTEALQFWTKVMNIALMPLIVAFIGIVLAIARRKRGAAQAQPA